MGQLRVILTTSELIADIMYVPALCILNLFLLVSSTACLYLGSIMINIYLLPYLDLMNAHFATVPYLILAIGGLLLLVSIFGIAAAAAKSRVLLLIYSIVLGLAFVLQLASIFTSMELRNELQLKLMFVKRPPEVLEEMQNYWTDPDVKFKWDTLQRDFQCCGAWNLRTGYQDWQTVLNKYDRNDYQQGTKLPDSCCVEESKGCGQFEEDFTRDQLAFERINVHGCFFIMKERLHRDIVPVLLNYIICAVVLALLTILTVVLAAAYVAAITRKANQEKDGMGMYSMPGAHTGSNRYEDTTISRPYADTIDSGIVNGSLRSQRSIRSQYSQLQQETPIIKGENHRSSMYIEPSNEAGTVI